MPDPLRDLHREMQQMFVTLGKFEQAHKWLANHLDSFVTDFASTIERYGAPYIAELLAEIERWQELYKAERRKCGALELEIRELKGETGPGPTQGIQAAPVRSKNVTMGQEE